MAMVDISAMLLLLLLVRSSYQYQITCRVTCQMSDTLIFTCTCRNRLGFSCILRSGILTPDSLCTCAFVEDLKMLCNMYNNRQSTGSHNRSLCIHSAILPPCHCTELESEIQDLLQGKVDL